MLRLEVIRHEALDRALTEKIIEACSECFKEPMKPFIEQHTGGVHVLGWLDDHLVGHASWVPRWLQPSGLPVLQTAYVEDVCTLPAFERRGFGSEVMRCMAEQIRDFELGALATGSVGFYARLGWERWRGKTQIRTETGLVDEPEDGLMILRLPRTPPLDLDAAISAEWRAGEVW